MISFETGKKRVLPYIQLNSPLDEWTRYFIHREQIKLSKNKMDSRAIKSHQCSLEKPHVVSALILNYHQGLALFKQKQILRSTVVTNIYKKQNNEDFFIQLLNAWLHITNWPNHIFKSTIQTENLFSIASYHVHHVYNHVLSPLQHSGRNLILLLPAIKKYMNLLWLNSL